MSNVAVGFNSHLIDQVFGTPQIVVSTEYVITTKAEKESAMYDDCDETINAATDRLLNRVSNISYNVRSKLYSKYGLEDDEAPNTAKELVDRITSGKYILPASDNKNQWWGNYLGIQWRDPSVKIDKDGFKAAEKTLTDLATVAKDEIYVLPAEKGLESLRTFEKAANALLN